MKQLLLIFSIAISLGISAQKAGDKVKVTNFGDLYSTYAFSEEDKRIIEPVVGVDSYANVVSYANEKGWPDGISDFTMRQTKREQLEKYKLTFVGFLAGGDKALVKAPTKKNKKMKGDVKLTHDIYFVIKSSSVMPN